MDWWKDVFSFGLNDIKFLLTFPLEFMGFHVNIPPQTKFNGGEKMNSVVTTTSCILVAISGYIMWFPSIFPSTLVRLAYPTHDIFMIIATMMVCMHGYLGSLHPGSGESFWGMVKVPLRPIGRNTITRPGTTGSVNNRIKPLPKLQKERTPLFLYRSGCICHNINKSWG